MKSDDLQIYTSLTALQQGSDRLIASLPQDEFGVSDSDGEAVSERIAQFIDRATASGTVLDTPSDRRAAQALIDFWLAKSFEFPRETRAKQRTPTRANTLLKPFDSTTVISAINNGDALLASLGEDEGKNHNPASHIVLRMIRSVGDWVADCKHFLRRKLHAVRMSGTGRTCAAMAARTRAAVDFCVTTICAKLPDDWSKRRLAAKASVLLNSLRNLAKKILLRMMSPLREKAVARREIARLIMLRTVRMEDSGRSYEPVAVNREDLLSLGRGERVNEVLRGLLAANVLSNTSGQISLRYDALIREWSTFRSWIDQRISFRDAAIFWDRSARTEGALLPGALADKALADYADLNALEQAFIAASSSHSRRLMFAVSALSAVLFLGFGFFFKSYYDDSMARKREADAATEVVVANSTIDARSKEQSIRKLASYGKPLKFQSHFLHSLDLNGIYAGTSPPAIVEIVRSGVLNVILKDANLPYASFSQSEIQNVDFSNAELTSARFDGVVLASTKFSDAKLYRAIFDRAQLRQVDFSNTDLRSTSFRHVKVGGDLVFTGTAWWLAFGWTLPQIDRLVADYKDFEIKNAKVFNEDVASRRKKVVEATIPEDRVQALNELAWTYAIYGVNLEKAKEHAQMALDEMGAIKGKSETWIATNRTNFADTMAYIWLQEGHPAQAVELLGPGIETSPEGDSMFRYAVALHALAQGKEQEERERLERKAQAYLASSLENRNYLPSHELYLLRHHITGKFKEKLAAILSADPR
jgi:hypothetical protein